MRHADINKEIYSSYNSNMLHTDRNVLSEIRRLEERLQYASPRECAALTKKLVRLKTALFCGTKRKNK